MPKRTRPAEVEGFVRENRRWIDNALQSFAEELAPDSYELPSRIHLPAIARRAIVAYRRKDGTRSVRHRELGDTLVLSGPVHDETKVSQALKRWLSKVAKREFEPRLRELSRELELPFEKLQIRAQRTCWGSHSSSGTISLNLCLLFLKPRVVRYLMVHELCHGRFMDHSSRFWRLVGQHEPQYRRLDRALTDAWREVPGWLGVS